MKYFIWVLISYGISLLIVGVLYGIWVSVMPLYASIICTGSFSLILSVVFFVLDDTYDIIESRFNSDSKDQKIKQLKHELKVHSLAFDRKSEECIMKGELISATKQALKEALNLQMFIISRGPVGDAAPMRIIHKIEAALNKI